MTSTDFVIITALEGERDALLSKLPGVEKLSPQKEDIRVYFTSRLPVKNSTQHYNIVVLTLLNMGRVEAANATNDAIRRWSPQYIIFVGIAGGISKNEAKLGDVLVADQIVDYEQQKLTPKGAMPRDSVHRVNPRLLGAAQNFVGDDWLSLITQARPAEGSPKRLIGPIATGDKIIAQKDALSELLARWPKLIGVEMEAGGASSASFQSQSQPGFFMVRGVSDLADNKKDSAKVRLWRSYACDVAAAYTIALLQSGPLPTRESIDNKENERSIFDVPYSRNAFFTGRENYIDQIHSGFASSQLTSMKIQALNGLGGIGKTQIALEYVHRNANNYRHIFWIQAASHVALYTSFSDIATQLDLAEKDVADSLKAAQAVINWLESNDGWLLVFDNADHPETVKEMLPKRFTGHVLLTSRAQVLDMVNIVSPIEISEMSREEALEFLIRRAGRNQSNAGERDAASKLAEELGYLPLALEQAGAFIAAKKVRFQDYLTSFLNRRLDLLNDSHPVMGEYSHTVATTWSMNFEEVEAISPASADLLRLSAFLNSHSIPLELLIKGREKLGTTLAQSLIGVEDDPVAINDVIEPLIRFSLISCNVNSYTFNIHRLVQEVIRLRMEPQAQQQWVERAVCALEESFPPIKFEYWHFCDRLLAHTQTVAKHIESGEIELPEAGKLFNEAGVYAKARAQYNEAEKLYKQSLIITEKTIGTRHPNYASTLGNLGELYRTQGRYKEAEQLFTRSASIILQEAGPAHPALRPALHNLALVFQDQGRYSDAEMLMKYVLALWQKTQDYNHSDYIQSLDNLASIYRATGRYSEAESLILESFSSKEGILSPDHPDLASAHSSVALLYNSQGRFTEARELFERALSIWEGTHGPDHPLVGSALNNLALVHIGLGNFAQAEPLLKRAVKIYQSAFGPEHPELATGLANIATIYINLGRYNEAESYCKQSLYISEKVLEAEHPELAATLDTLATIYHKQGKYSLAESLLNRALQIREKALGQEHPHFALNLNNLAALYESQGQLQKAEPLYRRALEIQEKALELNHPDAIASLNNLAVLYCKQNKYSEAEPLFDKVLPHMEQLPTHPKLATVLNTLATVRFYQHRYSEAESFVKRAISIREQIFGPYHSEMIDPLTLYANVLLSKGRVTEAANIFRQLKEIERRADQE